MRTVWPAAVAAAAVALVSASGAAILGVGASAYAGAGSGAARSQSMQAPQYAQSAQSPQPPQTGTGVVAGQVVDATTGQPLGGAVVILALSGGGANAVVAGNAPPAPAAQRRGVAVANGEGRFVFRDVPAGAFTITTTLDGYAPGMSGRKRPGGTGQSFSLDAGARITNARIDMWKLASISGSVRDDRGEPVIGLSISTLRVVMNGGRQELTFSGGGATDDRGQYRAFNLMPGSYVVGFRSSWNTVPVATADEHRAAIAAGSRRPLLMGTGAIQIQGKQLTVGDWATHFNSWEPPAIPGPDGTVQRFPNLYHPNAASPADAVVITLAPGEERSGIDFAVPLVSGVRVSGVLMGPDGPAVGHGIRLLPADRSTPAFDIPVSYGQTDANGRFGLLGVTPGSYVVEAYRVQQTSPFRGLAPPPPPPPPELTGGRRETPTPTTTPLFADTAITVGASHVDNVALTLRPGTSISGRVVFDGTAAKPTAPALQKISVSIRPLVGTSPAQTDATVDAEGRFAFSGFRPGRYVLTSASAPAGWSIGSFDVGGIDAAGQAFTIGESPLSAVLTFTDKTISLGGTVTTAGSDSDLAGSTVVIVPADIEEWMKTGMSPRRMTSAVVSATGAFTTGVALPGDYMAIAVPPDVAPDVDRAFLKRFASAATRVTLRPGDSKSVTLTLARVR